MIQSCILLNLSNVLPNYSPSNYRAFFSLAHKANILRVKVVGERGCKGTGACSTSPFGYCCCHDKPHLTSTRKPAAGSNTAILISLVAAGLKCRLTWTRISLEYYWDRVGHISLDHSNPLCNSLSDLECGSV
jgi:hypothetical protein